MINPPFIPRAMWGYRGNLGPGFMQWPAREGVSLHHAVIRPTADPCKDMRRVAATGIDKFGRLSYSYALHPSGVVLEGMGDRIGAHTQGHNSTTIGVVVLGDLRNPEQITPDLVRSGCWLMHVFRSFGMVRPRFKVTPHREWPGASTECPADAGVHQLLPYLQAVASDPSWRP